MGYGVIPIIASVILAIHHVTIAEASRRSRLTVALVVTASLVIWRFFPRWIILAMLLQVVVSIYMLIHLQLNNERR